MAIFRVDSNPYPGVVTNMDDLGLGSFLSGVIVDATDSYIAIEAGPARALRLYGRDLTYSPQGQLIGGVIDRVEIRDAFHWISMRDMAVSGPMVWDWLARNAFTEALQTIYGGNDQLYGSNQPELLRGYAGDDRLEGGAGSDSLFGGSGNDTIFAVRDLGSSGWPVNSSDSEFLRGEEGNDCIIGSDGFDDIHGNEGNDIAFGGRGNDWVVGGQGSDLLYGGSHADIVYGNMGNDTLYGDGVRLWSEVEIAGADTLRGGQGDDSIVGGGGDDWIWGDRGDDTISGGSGADVFHIFAGAGLDRVIDFNAAEGDRVVLEGGPSYVLRQEGGDTVIDLGGGDRMVLVGVNLGSLPPGWISAG
jgi:serralysin